MSLCWSRPVATGDIRGQCPPNFCALSNFVVPRKNCFQHIIKAKVMPHKDAFCPAPPKLKTWLRAFAGETLLHYTKNYAVSSEISLKFLETFSFPVRFKALRSASRNETLILARVAYKTCKMAINTAKFLQIRGAPIVFRGGVLMAMFTAVKTHDTPSCAQQLAVYVILVRRTISHANSVRRQHFTELCKTLDMTKCWLPFHDKYSP